MKLAFFHRWLAFGHDILWVPASIFIAFWFRFNLSDIPPHYQSGLYRLILLAIPIYAIFFRVFCLYRGLWRFTSMSDLIRILKAVTLGSLVLNLSGVVFFKLEGVPRSILLFSPLLLVVGLLGGRILWRIVHGKCLHYKPLQKEVRRTLIVGAGQAGDLLLRDLLSRSEYLPVAIVDDDKKKFGREIHGVRVFGGLADIQEVINQMGIDLVLFAIPSHHKNIVPQLITDCGVANVEFKTLPSIHEGNRSSLINAGQLRSLTLDDLLGRDPVQLDQQAISSYLVDKTVLITGSGGSIGSELCRQVSELGVRRLVLFDNGEFNLYSIDYELCEKYPDLVLETILGDVKDIDRVNWVFSTFRPNVVFHAAAYKHVPMVECNPAEGVSNNVIGTKNIADAADSYGTDRFVLISTDKAVNPANVMGATKRVAEIYCQNLNDRSATKFITTRFGNVLGSAGSVVPLFQKQIEDGGPVTVTHKEITRYFMTIPESVSLILQAGAMGSGGELFVLDMDKPVLIRHLAEQMITLSGLKAGEDIKIIYTGLRPGEKLFEELLHVSEELLKTNHPKLLLASARRDIEWDWLEEELDELSEAVVSRDIVLLKERLQTIVPEYSAQ